MPTLEISELRWYSIPGEFQGLVIDEDTGKTVAVCYDPVRLPLLASAPNLYAAAVRVLEAWDDGDLAEAVRELSNAVYEAGCAP